MSRPIRGRTCAASECSRVQQQCRSQRSATHSSTERTFSHQPCAQRRGSLYCIPTRSGQTHPLLRADSRVSGMKWEPRRTTVQGGDCCWGLGMPLHSVDGEVSTLGALSPRCPRTWSHTADIPGRVISLPGRGKPDQLAQGGMKTRPSPHFLPLSVTIP